MLHIVFDRPSQLIKAYEPDKTLAHTFRGEGDAWGWTPEAPYAHDGWMAPGHYVLGDVQRFDPPINSEGFGQIPILDLTHDVADKLVAAGDAKWNGLEFVIGGISAKIGQMAVYGRAGIMNHCGGSNAPNPLADFQMLCKTFGCSRMWNAEWRQFAAWLDGIRTGHTVVYSAIGDPVRLAA